MKTTSKMKTASKIKITWKMKVTSIKICLPPLKEYYLQFFLWHLTSTATGQLILKRICYWVSKPEMELHMINTIYVALPMCTNRKNDIFMQRRLVQSFTYMREWGQQTCTLTKHTRRWTYSALRHFYIGDWNKNLHLLTTGFQLFIFLIFKKGRINRHGWCLWSTIKHFLRK